MHVPLPHPLIHGFVDAPATELRAADISAVSRRTGVERKGLCRRAGRPMHLCKIALWKELHHLPHRKQIACDVRHRSQLPTKGAKVIHVCNAIGRFPRASAHYLSVPIDCRFVIWLQRARQPLLAHKSQLRPGRGRREGPRVQLARVRCRFNTPHEPVEHFGDLSRRGVRVSFGVDFGRHGVGWNGWE
jgi:hypothetical protein